ASRSSGGALFEGLGPGGGYPHGGDGSGESPVASAARRMGVDGAWQVRVAACAALAAVTDPGAAALLFGARARVPS
ncbi:unnamed protein product, partial [Prorocentrum cordatum]